MILSCIDCCSLLLTGCAKTEDLEKCLICIKNECARYLRVIVRNIEPFLPRLRVLDQAEP